MGGGKITICQLTSLTDPAGQTTSFESSAAGHLAKETDSLGKITRYLYEDGRGDLTSVTGPDISYNFAYDTLGRMTGITDSRGYSLSYTYNDLGQRSQVTLPGSQVMGSDLCLTLVVVFYI